MNASKNIYIVFHYMYKAFSIHDKWSPLCTNTLLPPSPQKKYYSLSGPIITNLLYPKRTIRTLLNLTEWLVQNHKTPGCVFYWFSCIPVCIWRYSLFSRGIKFISSRVIFICRSKQNRMLSKSSEYFFA